MEIFSEEQNPADGREEDRESELPLGESTSHSSGPSEIARICLLISLLQLSAIPFLSITMFLTQYHYFLKTTIELFL
jgi:hypothetical protein